MGWAEKRVEEYRQGQKATWREKVLLGYWNPVNLFLFVVGSLTLGYGLWQHNWFLITGGALAVLLVGNLYVWFAGWAENRIEEYRTGSRPPTWWEKRGLEEANPSSSGWALSPVYCSFTVCGRTAGG